MSNMGRSPCRSKEGLDREAWTAMEDMILTEYIRIHGDGAWANLPEKAGLKRCGKSCRLHCLNYLRPAIKSGNISLDEEDLIIRMHRLLGNRWSPIAGRLPGRTDNEIKNYWNTRLSKKLLLMNESQTSLRTQSLKTSSDSPPLQRNRVFKTPPLKTTTVVTQAEMAKPNGCNSDACTKSITDEDLSLCNVKETMNCPKSQCDLPRNDFIIDNDSVNILFSNADVNFIETETRSSTCSLPEKQSSNSDHFAGDEATLADNSLYLKELSSPQWNLLLSPSYFSTDFGLEDFYREPITTAAEKNDYEDIIFYPSNMQPIDSFRVADCQEMEEFHVNWNVNSITFRTDKEELEETDRTKLGVSRPWTLTR